MHLSDYIQEKYNPLYNKGHQKSVEKILSIIDKDIKSNIMSKEDVLDMLQDLTLTIQKQY